MPDTHADRHHGIARRAISTNTPPAVGLTMLAADERTIHRRSATYRSVCSQQKSALRGTLYDCIIIAETVGAFQLPINQTKETS